MDLSTETPREDRPALRLAVIDIGSNSLRLMIGEIVANGEFRILDEERESTRLASTFSATGRLGDKAIDDSLSTLRRFNKICTGIGVNHLRTIATCAVREAENGPEFCRRALEEVGVPVEVISARQEALYAFASVRRAFNISDRNVAVADLGGASTEIVLASAGMVEQIYDTSLGAIRFTELHAGSQRLFGDDYEQLVLEISRQLKRSTKRLPFVPQVLFGCGGTFTNLAAMLLAAKGRAGESELGYRVTRAEVRHLAERLSKLTVKQRRGVPGLNSDRADIIVTGLAIIDCIMRRLKVNLLQVHTGGVRDGLMYSMIEELAPPQQTAPVDRRHAIERLAENCGVDRAHASQVARLACEIFDQLVGPCHLDPEDRELLDAAAMLQDVGYVINYDRHHKHTYQLIFNGQLPGFTRRQIEIIANVARYHRGARPKKKHVNFGRLTKEDRLRVSQLVAILRLAAGLDRSHSQHVESVEVRVFDGQTRMMVRTRDDPEVDLWGARRRRALFERVFCTEVALLPVIANSPEP
jgi:exopolyphosphatase/guanosine-5'-triphosphate,3'-diphosphate pyrophosphatase